MKTKRKEIEKCLKRLRITEDMGWDPYTGKQLTQRTPLDNVYPVSKIIRALVKAGFVKLEK